MHTHVRCVPVEALRAWLLTADMGVGGSAGSGADPGVRWKTACRWYWNRTEVPLKEGGMPSGSCSLRPWLGFRACQANC